MSLDALVGLVSLHGAEDTSREQVAEWLDQALIHQAGKRETKEKGRKLLADLATGMGQERNDEAVRRGEAQDLDEILAEASAS